MIHQFANNGHRFMFVGVPLKSFGFAKGVDSPMWLYYYNENRRDIHDHSHIEFNFEFEILGSYFRKERRIDFADKVKSEWVEKYNNGAYRNYGDKINLWMPDLETNDICLSAAESFLSLIEAEIVKAGIEAERVLIIETK